MAAASEYDEVHDVIVVGAGISGLRAASELKNNFGLDVVVLEARGKIGGRVQEDWTFLPGRPLELGAEFIHGDVNAIAQLCEEKGWNRRHIFTWSHGDGGPAESPAPDMGIGYYYLGKEGKLLRYDSDDEDMHKCNEALWKMQHFPIEEAEKDKRTLRQYLLDEGVPERMVGLACAGYGNTAGGTADTVPVTRAMRMERAWHGDGSELDPDFRMDPSFHVLIGHLSEGLDVRTSSPVASVRVDTAAIELTAKEAAVATAAATATATEAAATAKVAAARARKESITSELEALTVSPGAAIAAAEAAEAAAEAAEAAAAALASPARPTRPVVIVTTKDGRRFAAHRVVVTVPLPVMKAEEIAFLPPLRPAKVAAAKSLSFANGVKIVLRFNKRAWPTNCHGVVCADSFIPEMWMNSSKGVGAPLTGRAYRKAPPAGSVAASIVGVEGDAAAADAALHAEDPAGTQYTVTGFLMGVRADKILSENSQSSVIARMLSQIERMFGFDARTSFEAGFVHNWAGEEYIRGAYSTPTIHEDAEGARLMAEPHLGVVYFAGEATAGAIDGTLRDLPHNRTHFAPPIVLHGALNTGTSAACDTARSLGFPVTCTDEGHAHFVPHYTTVEAAAAVAAANAQAKEAKEAAQAAVAAAVAAGGGGLVKARASSAATVLSPLSPLACSTLKKAGVSFRPSPRHAGKALEFAGAAE